VRFLIIASLALVLCWSTNAVAETEHGHGETHAEASGGHGEEHGGGHGGAGIENWFSWSFGEGKKYQNGPFAFAILNFIILLLLLRKFASKPFRDYLQNRHASIKNNLKEAAEMREQARQKLAEMEAKLKNLDREITQIKEHVAKDAQLEKERIIDAARQEAERLVQQADQILDKDLRRTRKLLEAEAVSAAMEAAEKMIKQQITTSDRRRLNEEYFDQILSSGGNQ
jgi:F-type H+-transporting ATPase subunit b